MRSARTLALLVAAVSLAAPSCSTPPAEAASLSVMAFGDTAKITYHWPAVNKAVSYSFSIVTVASNGTWTNPTNVSTTAVSGQAQAISTTADTAVFQVCATAIGLSSSSPIGCSSSVASAKNTWRRTLSAPAPTVDTVAIRPNPITLQLASSRIACAFEGFHDGQIGERTADKPVCDSLYQASFTAAHRAPSAAEQTYADTATWQWSTANPTVIGLVPQGLGSSAVLVQGNGLTLFGPRVPLERYASADLSPVARVDSTYRKPDGSIAAAVTCLRPGSAVLTVRAERVSMQFPLECDAPAWIRVPADALVTHRT